MLGTENKQNSFLDIETWSSQPLVDQNSIYSVLASWGSRLVKDEDFSDIYSSTGRPSVSPALLAKVLLLMYHDNVSDREAEERAKYDLRWKVALSLPLNESGFDYTAICRFRTRLLINHKQKLVFERFIRLAKDAGIIKKDGLQIVDSTHILGAAAVKDTYGLIKNAIQKLLKVCNRKNGKAQEIIKGLVLSLDYNQKGKEEIVWNDADAREKLLNQLVNDSRTLCTNLAESELSFEERTAVEILKTITAQDIEETDNQHVKLKQGVAQDRIISVVDPEIRHGHKTSSGKFNGYKGQIMVDESSEVITNVSVTAGNRPDGEAVDDLLETSTVKPAELMGDTAYGTLAARDAITKHEVTPIAPLPMGGKKTNRFGKYDFTLDFEQLTCKCPAGQVTTKVRISKGQISAFVFPKQTCNQCPLREQCTKHGKGKTVSVHPEEERRREIIRENQSVEFQTLYRRRAKVERKNAHLVRRGIRKSRYLGKARTLLQLAFTAAVVNMKRIFTLAADNTLLFKKLQKVMATA